MWLTMPIATYFVANGTSLRCKVTQNRLNYQTFLHKIMATHHKCISSVDSSELLLDDFGGPDGIVGTEVQDVDACGCSRQIDMRGIGDGGNKVSHLVESLHCNGFGEEHNTTGEGGGNKYLGCSGCVAKVCGEQS